LKKFLKKFFKELKKAKNTLAGSLKIEMHDE